MAAAAFLGLTLGVAALIVSLALLAGFQTHVRRRLVLETPHLLVTPVGRAVFRAEDRLETTFGSIPGVASVAPVARGRLWVTLRGQVDTTEAVGRQGVSGLKLDSSVARRLGALPGEEVTLVSSRTRLSPLGPVPIVTSLVLSDIGTGSLGRRAPEASLPLADARRLFALGEDGATGYELRLSDPSRAAEVARLIQSRVGPAVSTTTWEEANRALVLALRLERIVLFATVFLIVIVAGLNLAATSAVLAATRAGDAAILAVLGATPRTVQRVFLAAGGGVGVLGTAIGLVIGATAAIVLDRTGAIPLPAQLYSLSHVPFRVDPFDLATVGSLSVLWSLLSASIPARTASRRNPAEVLRAL